jgi:hypothetical protein
VDHSGARVSDQQRLMLRQGLRAGGAAEASLCVARARIAEARCMLHAALHRYTEGALPHEPIDPDASVYRHDQLVELNFSE